MRTSIRRTTHTKSTMRRRSMLTRLLVSGSATLLLVNSASCLGPKQDFVPTVSQTSQSMEELQDVDWDRLIAEAHLAEARAEAEVSANAVVAKYSLNEVTLVARVVWGEARGCSREEQMLVVWCICNRADAKGQSIEQVVTARNQFHGYRESNPVDEDTLEVVREVLEAWSRGEEALVLEPYATTSDYQFFNGDGRHNWFREEY